MKDYSKMTRKQVVKLGATAALLLVALTALNLLEGLKHKPQPQEVVENIFRWPQVVNEENQEGPRIVAGRVTGGGSVVVRGSVATAFSEREEREKEDGFYVGVIHCTPWGCF